MHSYKLFVICGLVLCSSSIISAFNGWSIPDEAENSDIEGWPAESDNQGEEEAWSGWGSNFEDGEGWGWPSNSENDEFRESRQTSSLGRIAVAEHNKYRRRHKVPNLQGSSGLDASAQKYANYLASINVLKHSDNRKYGENLATSFMKSKEAAVRDAIKRWYDEIKDYKWGNPGFSLKTGHFTAVVWKATKQVGIGVAQNSKTKKYFVVAHYSPPGNMNNAVGIEDFVNTFKLKCDNADENSRLQTIENLGGVKRYDRNSYCETPRFTEYK